MSDTLAGLLITAHAYAVAVTRKHQHLDEDDVRVRPGKSKSRARSKIRPEHGQAVSAMVTAVDRGRFTTVLEDGVQGDEAGTVFAVKAREIGRKGIVVGDKVDLVGDVSGADDALARIVRRQERHTALRRSADDTDPIERVVVANADQLVIVVAAANPEPRPRLVDRALIAAIDGGLSPIVLVTKTDLADAAELAGRYAPLDIPVLQRTKTDPVDDLRKLLRDKVSVLLGHSGVGKSTLVNALVPQAERTTGSVNAVTGRGRHTSTSAVAFWLPEGGWVIDTPGIRSFGLAHVDLARFMHAFPDLEAGTVNCPRGCTHDDEHCGLDEYVAEGHADPARLTSLRRLLSSRAEDVTTN